MIENRTWLYYKWCKSAWLQFNWFMQIVDKELKYEPQSRRLIEINIFHSQVIPPRRVDVCGFTRKRGR